MRKSQFAEQQIDQILRKCKTPYYAEALAGLRGGAGKRRHEMRWLIGFGLVASVFACASAAFAQNNARATRIITGLEPTYYIVGTPRVAHTLAERMQHYRVPAVSIAVIDNYRIVWAYATGRRDVASNAPASTTTLFQAASMSKAVAAAAILRLFEEKHLNLDADVNLMLHSWHVPPPGNSAEQVTMRRLLSHSAGVNVSGFVGYDRDAPLPTLVQVLDGMPPANNEAIRVTAAPGSATKYSGGGTSIAQQLAIDVSGEAFPTFMQRTLLGPLGMMHSTFAQPLPEALWPLAADGYYGDGRPVHRGWHVYPTMAAAGLWTTPRDLAIFVIAIQNALRGEGKPPIDSIIARQMTTKTSDAFGLGPELEPGYFTHSGANEGFQGIFLGLDKGGKGVVVMTNSDNGLQVADEIVHSVAKAYGWPVLQPEAKAAVPLTATAMQDVAGKYAAKFDSQSVTLEVTIGRSGGAQTLFMRASVNGGIQERLYAETPLQFFTLDGGLLVFSHGDGGRATSVQAGGMKYERLP
jgi:CubicO group peptidase (beta-lactamase class C family)